MLSRQKRRQRQFQCAGRSKRLQYEKMESRRLLAVIPVAPGDENLRAAIVAADSNSDASNTLQLSAGDYTISDYRLGQLACAKHERTGAEDADHCRRRTKQHRNRAKRFRLA